MMELLSPAGDRAALLAAIAGGADAVYLGFQRFGARSNAGNFDADGLREAVSMCHVRGIRVHVTVNTLLKQGEMPDALALLSLLCSLGVDAVIIQDLGLLSLARRYFPALPLHASTQMTLHNRQGVEWAAQMGISRVVAARECSLEELACMAEPGLEIEAFVHGALCVSVSGQCLFSSMLGERSGNRGQCAQPCRLAYRWQDQSGALLSPKDQMLMQLLPELEKAGVSSLKIEGRMKKPDYVYWVTQAYRQVLMQLENGCETAPDAQTLDRLVQVFHRGGFSLGHVGSSEDAALIYPAFSGHEGIPLGTVKRRLNDQLYAVALQAAVHDGDLLRIGDKTFVYSGSGADADAVTNMRMPFSANIGDRVYKQTDVRLQKAADAALPPRIPVDMFLWAYPGMSAQLHLTDGVHELSVASLEPVQEAQNRAIDTAFCKRQLEKTGKTVFELQKCEVETADAYLSAAALNDMRTRALDALYAARIQSVRSVHEVPCPTAELPMLPVADKSGVSLLVRGADAGQAKLLFDAGATVFEWMPQDYRPTVLSEACQQLPSQGRCRFVLPEVLDTSELSAIHSWVCAHASAFEGVVVANPSQLMHKWGMPVHADAPLHVMNPWAAGVLYEAGCQSVTASPELTLAQLKALSAHVGSLTVQAYGRERLMLLSHCPARVANGLDTQHVKCQQCMHGKGVNGTQLKDRQGVDFPLQRLRSEQHCRVRLLNSVPTDMSKHFQRLRSLGADLRLSFTTESQADRLEIVKGYQSLLSGGEYLLETPHTTGHYFRDIL